jgi:transcriptional antiterminator RfaH
VEEGGLRLTGIRSASSVQAGRDVAIARAVGPDAGFAGHASSSGAAVADPAAYACAARPAVPDAPGKPEDWIGRGLGRWWVLHTRARNEKRVASLLAEQHVRHYLPLVKVHHTYAKARVTFRVPLFPGYLFLCGEHSDCDKARSTHRIVSILHVADQDRLRAELRHICRVVEGGKAVELFPALQVGHRCRITRGALQGVEGVAVRHGGRCRMYLSVSTLGQSAMVEVDAALLEAID